MSNKDFAAYIEQASEREFDWDSANCAHFVSVWVQQVEGRDALKGLADNVGSRLGAARRIEELGGLVQAATDLMGRNPIPVSLGRTGDLVCIRLVGDRQLLGLCAGRTAVFLTEGSGCVHVEMDTVLAAWPVGRDA